MVVIVCCEKFKCPADIGDGDNYCFLGFCEHCSERKCFNCAYYYTSKCPHFKEKELSDSDSDDDNLPF